MFTPSQHDVRDFFCTAWARHVRREPISPIESIAIGWILEHPEYHALLADAETARTAHFDASDGQGNPFLHLSMHLAISEQLSIDQPPGLATAFADLRARVGSAHEAAHELMECLGEVLWVAQRQGQAPDGAAYLDCARRRTGQRGSA